MSGPAKVVQGDGLVDAALLGEDARAIIGPLHFEASTSSTRSTLRDAREAARIIDADGELSSKGKQARRADVAAAAIADIEKAATATVKALTARFESNASRFESGPVLLGDLVADRGLDPKAPRADARGIEAFDQLHRLRDAMQTMPGPALRELLETGAAEGDALVLAALDGLPRVIRESLEKRAGFDADSSLALRRSYRIARHPELERELRALGEVAAHVARNTRFALQRLREFGLVPPSAKRKAIDALLEPLAKLVRSATGSSI